MIVIGVGGGVQAAGDTSKFRLGLDTGIPGRSPLVVKGGGRFAVDLNPGPPVGRGFGGRGPHRGPLVGVPFGRVRRVGLIGPQRFGMRTGVKDR